MLIIFHNVLKSTSQTVLSVFSKGDIFIISVLKFVPTSSVFLQMIEVSCLYVLVCMHITCEALCNCVFKDVIYNKVYYYDYLNTLKCFK